MRLVYFVHDLNDAAVARRLAMLRAAGIDAALTGFWRGASPAGVPGCENVPLSQTHDGRLVHRALVAIRHASGAKTLGRRFEGANIFLARNLEMLLIAVAASRRMRAKPAIAYEVLDIHRTLLVRAFPGPLLRSIERALMGSVSLLITSSAAFLKEYFEARQFGCRAIPSLIVENKFFPYSPPSRGVKQILPAPPWRIGWFGVIRCRRSLELLAGLARRRPDLVQIQIRGRIAAPVRERLEILRQRTPAMQVGGAYTREELPQLYRGVHFNWTVDYFEAGGNSEWLLPNRLYEGGSFDAVPFALKRTETGRWLANKDLGVLFDNPEAELESFLGGLSRERYFALRRASEQAPRSLFTANLADCDRLAGALERAAAFGARIPHDVVQAVA